MSLKEEDRKVLVTLELEKGKLYSHLQKLREDGDYNCSIDIDEEDIVEKVTPTRMLIDKIVQYISDKQLGVCRNETRSLS